LAQLALNDVTEFATTSWSTATAWGWAFIEQKAAIAPRILFSVLAFESMPSVASGVMLVVWELLTSRKVAHVNQLAEDTELANARRKSYKKRCFKRGRQ